MDESLIITIIMTVLGALGLTELVKRGGERFQEWLTSRVADWPTILKRALGFGAALVLAVLGGGNIVDYLPEGIALLDDTALIGALAALVFRLVQGKPEPDPDAGDVIR
jgi:hypothetical protein